VIGRQVFGDTAGLGNLVLGPSLARLGPSLRSEIRRSLRTSSPSTFRALRPIFPSPPGLLPSACERLRGTTGIYSIFISAIHFASRIFISRRPVSYA
jgi:hypothetical protein